jgi:molybdenum cofactor biosynthesis protein B
MSAEEHKKHAPKAVRCFVLTVSDSRSEETDDSGRLCRSLVQQAGHEISGYRVLKDEPAEVAALVRELCDGHKACAVLLNGGTGISRRDSTYEAVDALLDKRLDGFGELFRYLSYQEVGSAAFLTRATAGLRGGVAVFAMPGAPEAVRLAMEKLVLPELGHVVGEAHR